MSAGPFGGVQPTLAEFNNWLATTPGLSDVDRAAALRLQQAYRQAVVDRMTRRYNDGADHNEREQETVARILQQLGQRMDEAIEQNRRREITAEELMSIAADVERDVKRMVAAAEAAEDVERTAWDEVNREPEDWQSNVQLARAPALKRRLPVINADVLAGRESPRF